MRKISTKSSVQYDFPTWNGDGFAEADAQKLWERMPLVLREIVIAEIESGNSPGAILLNHDSDVVLLSLSHGPMQERESDHAIKIHVEHSFGNYCYDGTRATYEHLASGHLLAFEDLDFDSE